MVYRGSHKLQFYGFLLVCFSLLSSSSSTLQWKLLDNSEAVCNDYSRAGYFLERVDSSAEWLIFLESGGLCYSPATCNARFFKKDKRVSYSPGERPWLENYNEFVNPYVTSMATFNQTLVSGRDLFDSNCSINPFCRYNKILVPYCSSDLWLGNVTSSQAKSHSEFRAQFNPNSDDFQFAFRGRIIFQSVMDELFEIGLFGASDVVLAGSSAGGLGAVNNAQWTRDQLPSSADLSIIADSSWFVNFRDIIYQGFNGTQNNDDMNLFVELISGIPQCRDTSRGSPCCLSLSCLLQEDRYFPVGEVPTIVLASLYDVYLLAYTINNTIPIGPMVTEGKNPSVGLEFLNIVSEYGGVMNHTLVTTSSIVPDGQFSYVATHCFQHIYIVTSSLWEEGNPLENESDVELQQSVGDFSAVFK